MSNKRAAAKAARLAEEIREAREYTERVWRIRETLRAPSPADFNRLMLAVSSATPGERDTMEAAIRGVDVFKDLLHKGLINPAMKNAVVGLLLDVVRRAGYEVRDDAYDAYRLRQDAVEALGDAGPEARRALPVLLDYFNEQERTDGGNAFATGYAIATLLCNDEELRAALSGIAEKDEARLRQKRKAGTGRGKQEVR